MNTVTANSALQTLQVSQYIPNCQMTATHLSHFEPRGYIGGQSHCLLTLNIDQPVFLTKRPGDKVIL